jgi:hypothetical protein
MEKPTETMKASAGTTQMSSSEGSLSLADPQYVQRIQQELVHQVKQQTMNIRIYLKLIIHE